MTNQPIKITIYRWAGQWGPFKISIPCGECALTADIVKDTLSKELADIPVTLDIRDWLSEWWKPLLAGAYQAPIVMVEGKVISQHVALNRGVLTEAVIEAHAAKSTITGTVIFGKPGCPYCVKAKELLDQAEIPYEYHDVIESPRALYEMLARAKQAKDFSRTPITTPQIWMDGKYVGGADDLAVKLGLPHA